MRGITITSIVTERGSQVWRQLAKGHARGGGLHRICIRIKIYFYCCCWWQFLKLEPLHLLAPVFPPRVWVHNPKNIHGSVALLNFRSQCWIRILYKHVPFPLYELLKHFFVEKYWSLCVKNLSLYLDLWAFSLCFWVKK